MIIDDDLRLTYIGASPNVLEEDDWGSLSSDAYVNSHVTLCYVMYSGFVVALKPFTAYANVTAGNGQK